MIDILCDTCRQHIAVRHFIDADYQFGPVERHICLDCPRPISAGDDALLSKRIVEGGRCQICSTPAFSVSGIPGPSREVLCQQCASQRYQTQE
jgi:hypothetical protein